MKGYFNQGIKVYFLKYDRDACEAHFLSVSYILYLFLRMLTKSLSSSSSATVSAADAPRLHVTISIGLKARGGCHHHSKIY